MTERTLKLRSLPRMWLAALAAIAILHSSLTVAQPTDPPPPRPSPEERQKQEAVKQQQQQESFARKMAEQLLNGREVLVRVYNDWQKDFRAYKLVPVKLKGLTVSFDDIKSAYGQTAQSLFPVVFGLDQTDKVLAAVLGDYVCAEVCRPGNLMYLWPPFLKDPKFDWWLFVDAIGNPIPGASVEILVQRWNLIGNSSESVEVSIGKAALDQDGRLKRLKRMDTMTNFVFIVSAPNYGTAKVGCAGFRSFEDSPQTYIVPLVPLDSQAASRAVSGFVVDPNGNPINGVRIHCGSLQPPDIGYLRPYDKCIGFSIPDSNGWFAMYTPINENNTLSTKLIPPGTKYHLSITPPEHSTFYREEETVIAGTYKTIVLASMDPNQYFYTFAFEDGNTPITDPQELRKIEITHYRGGREWAVLKYDDFKDGVYLQSGGLRARTHRWGQPYHFESIQLNPHSTEVGKLLTFKTGSPIVYKGMVINGAAGQPMPNVLILIGHSRSDTDPSSMTKEQWERLRAEILADPNGLPSPSPLHNHWNRVAVTDANGCYQVTFIPGFSNGLSGFTALERGYGRCSVPIYHQPNRLGVAEVWPITLTPTRPKLQKPTFVFEDESGPVTDPNLLCEVRLNKGGWKFSYAEWLQQPVFTPGTYEATADWHGKLYIFEPMEVTEQSPDTIVFKIRETKRNDITYRGQVVNGITGTPMPGAIVISCLQADYGDVSGIYEQEWDAINSLGLQPDPNDPALAPLREIFGFRKVARTGLDGWFKITFGPKRIEDEEQVIAVAKDYLASYEHLKYFLLPLANPPVGGSEVEKKFFEPDRDNCVTLFPMRLFPAGTVIIDPRIPDVRDKLNESIRFHWYARPDDTSLLKTDLENYHIASGSRLFYKFNLRPNVPQTAYIPAGLPLTIEVYPLLDQWGQANLGEIALQQGQTTDLGSVSFPRTFKVAVKVVNSQGRPVPKVRVSCANETGRFSYIRPCFTEEDGVAWFYVPPNSKGQFVVEARDTVNQTVLRESFPYQVADPENEGKEFTMQLSDQMLQQLRKESKPQ